VRSSPQDRTLLAMDTLSGSDYHDIEYDLLTQVPLAPTARLDCVPDRTAEQNSTWIALWLFNCNACCTELSNHCFEIRDPKVGYPALFGLAEIRCLMSKQGKHGRTRTLNPRLLLVACRYERDAKMLLVSIHKPLGIFGPGKQASYSWRSPPLIR